MTGRPMVMVSNRGPLSFRHEPGGLVARRGAGGLVSGIGPLLAGTDATWVAAAMSDADREAAASGVVEAEGFRTRMLAIDPADYRLAYDVVCNAALWFVHHGLFALAENPAFGRAWRDAWAAYERVNAAFADAVAVTAPQDAVVLAQDYHLTLLGGMLVERRPDLRTVHFTHTPFATPDWLRVLPEASVIALLEGLSANVACGFHTKRWADAFTACCDDVLGLHPTTFVSPLSPDQNDIAASAASPACADALATLDAQIGQRQFIVRVDRIELSKNLLRGFQSYDLLLAENPHWHERVVLGAFVYPSRENLEIYAAYRREVEAEVAAINERWGTADWQPVIYDDSDDFARSVAAMRRYDVLLVNPIRDGLNLVAKEGPLVNENDGVVVLSTEAGAWVELQPAALSVNPYDVAGSTDVLHQALRMTPEERATRARQLRRAVTERTPADWLADQVAAAG